MRSTYFMNGQLVCELRQTKRQAAVAWFSKPSRYSFRRLHLAFHFPFRRWRNRSVALANFPLVPDRVMLLAPILVDGAAPHSLECALFADGAHVDVKYHRRDV